jgi:hypothetical protein
VLLLLFCQPITEVILCSVHLSSALLLFGAMCLASALSVHWDFLLQTLFCPTSLQSVHLTSALQPVRSDSASVSLLKPLKLLLDS